ncbi:cyclohexanone monooxygenase [Penicillium mononematosum]|uniref:cyclohexanone monooxygenase n=1 Tax=Penicillium mononematosum TaxID=268346 RepID=UPI0025472E98|nr:cyclohexanone monooxygenase [Penicillium mononematosum]KAJ6180615.1 cyclohexanone monooxygenase [Penicillium mononematosum]
MSPIAIESVDALVVGAGFGGIYQLYSLQKLGLNVKAIERAEGVGGVWYWNNYPGAMSDTESFLYRYSWDKEDLQTYPWPNNYLTRDEIVTYLNHVVDKYGLRDKFQFSTELVSATWDESKRKWHIQTSCGDFIARYLFTAVGIQSTMNIPSLTGLGSFQGTVMHTATWNHSVDVSGRRVGVIGCGSSGIQVADALATKVAELHCFIRHAQFTVPLRLQPVTAAQRAQINASYDDIWTAQRNSATAFGFDEPTTEAMSVTPEEREQVFESLWRQGNGFRFMYGGFGDICSDAVANEEACKFMRAKIRSIVKDPSKADVLTPGGDNVLAVDILKTPIVAIERNGIRTSDGKLHELDIIVLATGFKSADGSYTTKHGIRTYASMFLSSFPNLFMVTGPQGPFSNAPTLIEAQVDFLTGMLRDLRGLKGVSSVIECTEEAETEWVGLCDQLAASETLFDRVDSWITGKNIPGAMPSVKFYYGGLKSFREFLDVMRAKNYCGLVVD